MGSEPEPPDGQAEPQPERPRMRRVPPGEWRSYKRAALFLDDLLDIEAAFRALGPIRIRADNYEFDGVSDLTELGRPEVESKLSIHCDSPYSTFEVDPGYWVKTYLSDTDDLKLLGLRTRVEEVIERHAKDAPARKPSPVSAFLARYSPKPPAPPPEPPQPWRKRNRDLVLILVSAVAIAVCTAIATATLVILGILKPA